jgi:hypothetical protein
MLQKRSANEQLAVTSSEYDILQFAITDLQCAIANLQSAVIAHGFPGMND